MEDFVTFEIAKKLKEKGFKEECLCHYITDTLVYNLESPIANNQMWFCHNKYDNIWHRDNYDAPTISQVFKWLEDKKKIFLTVDIEPKGFFFIINYDILTNYAGEYEFSIYNSTTTYPSPTKSALAGIEYVLYNLI